MTVPVTPLDVNDRSWYPLHEEDDVSEIPLHELVVGYLRGVLRAHLPGAFVTGNVCIYWVPGDTTLYGAPDVFVVLAPLPEPQPRVYHLWRDPPIVFVAEVSSRSTVHLDKGIRRERYAHDMGVPEYLRYDVDENVVQLWRLGVEGYEEVQPNASGRLRSEQLGLEFGLDDEGLLWAYTPDGERLLRHEEEVGRRRLAEVRARELEAQARAAEARANEEAKGRASEARRRRQAEARAREAQARAEAEAARAAELERQLAELRARLGEE
jgi:Uma2 family endonuclease